MKYANIRAVGLIAMGVAIGGFAGVFSPYASLVVMAVALLCAAFAAGWLFFFREPSGRSMTQIYPGVFTDSALDQQHAKEIERLRNLSPNPPKSQ